MVLEISKVVGMVGGAVPSLARNEGKLIMFLVSSSTRLLCEGKCEREDNECRGSAR